jgi:hypothetical protein
MFSEFYELIQPLSLVISRVGEPGLPGFPMPVLESK